MSTLYAARHHPPNDRRGVNPCLREPLLEARSKRRRRGSIKAMRQPSTLARCFSNHQELWVRASRRWAHLLSSRIARRFALLKLAPAPTRDVGGERIAGIGGGDHRVIAQRSRTAAATTQELGPKPNTSRSCPMVTSPPYPFCARLLYLAKSGFTSVSSA